MALTRGVSPAIAHCELTFLERAPIDHPRAVAQHHAYERRLEELGRRVVHIEADAAFPDCCSSRTSRSCSTRSRCSRGRRPLAPGRTAAVAEALCAYRPLVRLEEPARIDGGDVLTLGRRLFVGLSNRTDAAGREALAAAVRPFATR